LKNNYAEVKRGDKCFQYLSMLFNVSMPKLELHSAAR